MAAKKTSKSAAKVGGRDVGAQVDAILAELKRAGSATVRREMATRYGITGPGAEKSFGVKVGALQAIAKRLKKDALAAARTSLGAPSPGAPPPGAPTPSSAPENRTAAPRASKSASTRSSRSSRVAPASAPAPKKRLAADAKAAAAERAAAHLHDLALALWDTGWYEARLLAAFLDDPARVTPAQMDRWCRDFDNWAVVDTVCFHLFDRTPHALAKVAAWARRRDEFQRRAAFALLACVALHNKSVTDDELRACLPLLEAAATDDRNFVKKAVSWALRSVALRSPRLRAECATLANQLAASEDATARWIGKDAAKALGGLWAKQK